MSALQPFDLIPELKPKVWGGRRLVPDAPGMPIGEIWLAHGGSRIEGSSAFGGQTLDGVLAELGAALAGSLPAPLSFPLLLKLLDTSDWLSVQVHPDDQLAKALEGPQGCGKTESWYFLEVEPDAEILCGLMPETSLETVRAEVGTAAVVMRLKRLKPERGSSMLVPAGTPHALGPGLTLFELQQASNSTYRMYDWGRPANGGRELHLASAAKAIHAAPPPQLRPVLPGPEQAAPIQPLVRCAHFALERWVGNIAPLLLDTREETFHAVTLLRGEGRLEGDSWGCRLTRHRTTVVPASCGRYQAHLDAAAQALCASLS